MTDFQSGKGDMFLISLEAGGFGLNLTAADYVIHLDPWWNPAVEAQASDRAHRIGQQRPVTIYRLVNAASIEERVLSLHARKQALAEEILSDTAKRLGSTHRRCSRCSRIEEVRELMKEAQATPGQAVPM